MTANDTLAHRRARRFVARQLVPALQRLDRCAAPRRYCGFAAVHMLAMIAAHESHFRYRRQLGGGPALGLYQMEPDTLADLYANHLGFRPTLQAAADYFLLPKQQKLEALEHNDAFATVTARLQLARVPDPLPPPDQPKAMADYAKTHWNTADGAATPLDYETAYARFAIADIDIAALLAERTDP